MSKEMQAHRVLTAIKIRATAAQTAMEKNPKDSSNISRIFYNDTIDELRKLRKVFDERLELPF